MKIYILSAALLVILSCKKETSVSNIRRNDSVKAINTTQEDSTNIPVRKEETFKFTTELCDNKGHFDVNRYSKEQIEDTYKLWFQLGGTLLNTPSVFNLDGLQKVRAEKDKILAQLDKDFIHQKKVLAQLKVVDDPYWKNIKKQKQQELTDEYEFRKTEILAFSDPSILMNHTLSKNCRNFAEALYSNGPKMIEEWKKLREEMSRKNSDPGRIMSEFQEHLNSPDKNEYAVIDLITFGWGNCANNSFKKTEHDEKMYKKFNSLFIKIDSECDEP